MDTRKMSQLFFPKNLSFPWIYGLVGVALIGCLYFLPRRFYNCKLLTKEELLMIFKEISHEFHIVLSDLAQVMSNVLRSMESKGLEKVFSHDQLETMLLQQGYQNRMNNAQQRILKKHSCDQKELENATSRFCEDADVIRYVDGIKEMYSDALSGRLPIDLDLEIPKELTKDKILEMLKSLHKLKLAKFEEVFKSFDESEISVQVPDGGSIPSSSFYKRLQSANKEAEKEILKRFIDICPSSELFQQSIAFFSREADFLEAKQALENLYSNLMIDYFQQKNRIRKEADMTVIASIHNELNEVTADELQEFIVLSKKFSSPLCLLIVESGKNELKFLNELSEAIDRIELDCCSYVYMFSDEAMKTDIKELKKITLHPSTNCPVYILFLSGVVRFISEKLEDIENYSKTLGYLNVQRCLSKETPKNGSEVDGVSFEAGKNLTSQISKEELLNDSGVTVKDSMQKRLPGTILTDHSNLKKEADNERVASLHTSLDESCDDKDEKICSDAPGYLEVTGVKKVDLKSEKTINTRESTKNSQQIRTGHAKKKTRQKAI